MRWLCIFMVSIAVLSGCTDPTETDIDEVEDTAAPVVSLEAGATTTVAATRSTAATTVTSPTAPKWQTGSSDYLYDQQLLHTFELTISDDALAEIDGDPSKEVYVEASLTFEGETVTPVGVRYKGSIGAWVGCLTGTNIFQPAGAKTCTKLSMKVKINWNDRSRTFWGVKKLQFHSMNLDPTQMHERLGYWLFREMGVPAPRATHARLNINGKYVGLYAFVEQIDGRFVNRVFDDGDGNLYKEVWPLDENGDARELSEFQQALKTNEEDAIVTHIHTFSKELAAADKDELPGVAAKWTDIIEVMRWAVVDRAIHNDDGAMHWYCFDGCNNHNFYWYEEPASGQLHLIPWDLDNAFVNIVSDISPVTAIADEWGETSNDCLPFPYGAWRIPQRSAACDPLLGAWATFVEEHDRANTEFLNGPFSKENTQSMLDQWVAQIRDATTEAATTHSDALPVDKWNLALANLSSALEVARNNG
ncbi:MAG: CotH kinase family protein [Actinomycetota bacterium]|nr:CotH kinase family protein [Actinomycetota bacterium]